MKKKARNRNLKVRDAVEETILETLASSKQPYCADEPLIRAYFFVYANEGRKFKLKETRGWVTEDDVVYYASEGFYRYILRLRDLYVVEWKCHGIKKGFKLELRFTEEFKSFVKNKYKKWNKFYGAYALMEWEWYLRVLLKVIQDSNMDDKGYGTVFLPASPKQGWRGKYVPVKMPIPKYFTNRLLSKCNGFNPVIYRFLYQTIKPFRLLPYPIRHYIHYLVLNMFCGYHPESEPKLEPGEEFDFGLEHGFKYDNRATPWISTSLNLRSIVSSIIERRKDFLVYQTKRKTKTACSVENKKIALEETCHDRAEEFLRYDDYSEFNEGIRSEFFESDELEQLEENEELKEAIDSLELDEIKRLMEQETDPYLDLPEDAAKHIEEWWKEFEQKLFGLVPGIMREMKEIEEQEKRLKQDKNYEEDPEFKEKLKQCSMNDPEFEQTLRKLDIASSKLAENGLHRLSKKLLKQKARLMLEKHKIMIENKKAVIERQERKEAIKLINRLEIIYDMAGLSLTESNPRNSPFRRYKRFLTCRLLIPKLAYELKSEFRSTTIFDEPGLSAEEIGNIIGFLIVHYGNYFNLDYYNMNKGTMGRPYGVFFSFWFKTPNGQRWLKKFQANEVWAVQT